MHVVGCIVNQNSLSLHWRRKYTECVKSMKMKSRQLSSNTIRFFSRAVLNNSPNYVLCWCVWRCVTWRLIISLTGQTKEGWQRWPRGEADVGSGAAARRESRRHDSGGSAATWGRTVFLCCNPVCVVVSRTCRCLGLHWVFSCYIVR